MPRIFDPEKSFVRGVASSVLRNLLPSDIADLSFWIDRGNVASITESGGGVSQADDLSGNERHAVQTNPDNYPGMNGSLNGRAAFLFDQTKQFRVPLGPQGPATMIAIGRHTGTTQASFFGNTNSNTYLPYGRYQDTSTNYSRVDNNNDQTGRVILSDGESTQSISTRDDAHQAMTSGSMMLFSLPASIQAGFVRVGQGGLSSYTVQGAIGEAFTYSRQLTATEIAQIQGYSAHKWNWADDLPSNHPYKSAPPSVSA